MLPVANKSRVNREPMVMASACALVRSAGADVSREAKSAALLGVSLASRPSGVTKKDGWGIASRMQEGVLVQVGMLCGNMQAEQAGQCHALRVTVWCPGALVGPGDIQSAVSRPAASVQ